jgi:transcriptional regulator with XRE-family HTH domain
MERLQQYLDEQGLTRMAFAKSLGCNQSTIARYIDGIREPDFDMLKRIARKTGLTIDELVGYEPRKRKEMSTTAAP